MKRPGWLGGQGGPDPEEDSEDPERARAERARRERVRAQKRLAAMASGEEEEGKPPAKEPGGKRPGPKPKPEPESKEKVEPGAAQPKRKREPAEGKSKSKREPERKPEEKPARKRGAPEKSLPALGKEQAATRGGKGRKPAGSKARSRTTAGGAGAALKEGLKATRSRTRGLPSRVGRGVLAVLGPVFAVFFDVVGFGLNVLIWIAGKLIVPARALIAGLGRFVRFASALVTPARALTAVVAAAAVLLALSQFADYRSVTVGTDAYAEVETVAPAPEKERDETGTAHSYLMVPLAIASLLLLAAAVSGRRWRLCRMIAIAGGIAIAVSLLIDRPAGLDHGDLDVAFEGVRATLLGGFYAQLFSGFLLAATALLLSRELRLAGAPRPARSSSRSSPRRLLRRPPKAEGARA